ncbi:hypothetical protein GCM10011410_18750 [Hoyosella rhizosphaerae]|uniref:Uncharacterized protein n=1 Tax=Hoyosella rhizosphaerae TaxID=1755582 RepID=A0A916UB37_9ACTN|nr:hypothetical protein GCM10011410_18750 [Hoyosella rhizosphaerae]
MFLSARPLPGTPLAGMTPALAHTGQLLREEQFGAFAFEIGNHTTKNELHESAFRCSAPHAELRTAPWPH